ncbi:MAG: DNA polymerase III subunit delta' [Gammaproteobacteria bacterium]|jgi:DNA polymerase-3 subunit delta'
MTDDPVYPWQQSTWQHIVQRYQKGQLPHALLFSGPDGLGKRHFAEQLARALMCDRNHQVTADSEFTAPCGQCNGCHLMAAGTHPDFSVVQPEGDSKQIQIDRVREISQFLSLKSQFAPLQVIIVTPANAMNRYAANSLLKTLEEPTPGSLLLLISSRISRLLPTIRSRCQMISFTPPAMETGLQWLEGRLGADKVSRADQERLLAVAGGAPVLALQFAHNGMLDHYQQLLQSFEKLAKKQADPITEAKQWEAVGLAQSVKWLYLWVAALIRFKSAGAPVDSNGDNGAQWQEPTLASLDHPLNHQQLYTYLDKVVDTARMIDTSVNVQLTLEDLLTGWQQLHSSAYR